MTVNIKELNVVVQETKKKFQNVCDEIGKAVIGQSKLVESLLIAILSDGHLLLEGLPGLAKTLAVTTLSKTIDSDFKRIQFTPDLLPADLLGTSIYNPKTGAFSIKKGPLFTNIVLADEINRAPAKVQSALLEAMAEKQITISGKTFCIEDPFLVLATQNPVEQEGTYPLSEAQADRFMMKVKVPYPNRSEERAILSRMLPSFNRPKIDKAIGIDDVLEARRIVDEVYVDGRVMEYILDIVFATRCPKKRVPEIDGFLESGVSPRASIAMAKAARSLAFLNGRGFVTPHDVKNVGRSVLRHRLRLSYEAQAEDMSADAIIDKIFDVLLAP